MQQTDTKYLLRFDDLCPTMNWKIWSEIEAVLLERRLKPVLAVVPDNQDPGLQVDRAADDFWEHARRWQDWGWTIALHGFQHRYLTRKAGIVALRRKSEFAGLPRVQQEEKLRRGVEIFQREGIAARVWVAPGNSFDATTVSLLPKFGIRIICDGYFRFPFVCPRGMTWVPQQLFYFRPAPPGVWTVCFHHNQWTASSAAKFREDLARYGANICSLDDVLPENGQRESPWAARVCACPRLSRLVIRARLKLWSWRRGASAAMAPRRPEDSRLCLARVQVYRYVSGVLTPHPGPLPVRGEGEASGSRSRKMREAFPLSPQRGEGRGEG